MKDSNNPVMIKISVGQDKARVVEFWNRNNNSDFDGIFEWMYSVNQSHNKIYYLTDSSQGSIIGLIGLSNRTFKIGDQNLHFGQTIHFLVDREYRNLIYAIRLQKALLEDCKKNDIKILYGFPLPAAIGVQLRVGFRILGNFERWTKPLRVEYYLKKRMKNELLVQLCSFILNPLLKIISKDFIQFKSSDTTTMLGDKFNNQYDTLWEIASKKFKIIGDRSAKYLDWRYNQNPKNTCEVFSLFNKQNVLQGYIVFQIKDNIAIISDLLFDTVESLEAIFGEFFKIMRKRNMNAITIEFYGSELVTKRLKKLHFYNRFSGGKIVLYTDDDIISDVNMTDKNEWFITRADCDI